ncbi:MAG: acyl-CoA desaturase [Bacteroidetes bacterium]|nr:acyl-CoA desaturase [Bacteroidota bacterium]
MDRQNIKFPNQKNTQFVTELRNKVNAYFEHKNISKQGNAGLGVKTFFMFLLYIGPLILMMTGVVNTLAGMFIAWVVMGVGMSGVGLSVMHDANHRSFSHKSWMNKLFEKSMYLLGGFPLIWQHQHNTMHHGYTNIDGFDEDIEQGALFRFSPHRPLNKLHRFQHLYFWFFYSLSTLSWITAKEFKQLFRYRREKVKLPSKKSYDRLLGELILSKLVYYILFLVLPLIFLPFAWYWIVAGFVAMHFVCGLSLSLIFGAAHIMPDALYPLPDENQELENNWAIHQLLTTTNFSPRSKAFTWFIGGLNFQVEHHLFPNISHVHYPAIAAVVRDTALKYGLPYHVQPNFYQAVKNHVIMLKRLGRI